MTDQETLQAGGDVGDSEKDTEHTAQATRGWQDTLLALMTNQQKQMAELAQQAKMATPLQPTPVDNAPASVSVTSFRLPGFDPDKSSFAVTEWLEDATRLKTDLTLSDTVMIAKAGEALENRAFQYYSEWRPFQRTWQNFCDDLTVAFPDRETPGGRAFIAATLRSRDCDSLGDYGNQKLRNIRRFHDGLPWSTVVSMVEYGLDHNEARTAIHLQQPPSERELLKLLMPIGHFVEPTDSLRVVILPHHVVEVRDGTSRNKDDDDLRAVEDHVAPDNLVIADLAPRKQPHQLQSQGTALTVVFRAIGGTNAQPCGQPLSNEVPREPPPKHLNPNAHSPKTVMLMKRKRRLQMSPLATLLCNGKALALQFLIDSGAEVSVITQTAARKLGTQLTPDTRDFAGIGSQTVRSLGTCDLIATMETITLEIILLLVTDSPKILTFRSNNTRDIVVNHVSGLTEPEIIRLRLMLSQSRKQTPGHITTGTLRIELKDDIPVAYRPRRLSYSERLHVKKIVQELLADGIISESQSAYASPIVLVKE
uniref:Peptidase A2 domain-containing protein n=1 Tax=Tenebrio molitor TaxID=7067 RepID=A0A8J6H393_TENMO|nr:hypothetical protein GEV33_015412 [Tenebrio molitor]